MTSYFIDPKQFIGEAERKGRDLVALEKRNAKRRAKGRKPLMDETEKMEHDVLRQKYRTGDPTVVDAAGAMKLYEIRKAQLEGDDDANDEDDLREEAHAAPPDPPKRQKRHAMSQKPSGLGNDEEAAVREAAAARRVQDMKNGRIDHEGNWSDDGQRLDGGDPTVLVDKVSPNTVSGESAGKAWETSDLGDEQKGDPEGSGQKVHDAAEGSGDGLDAVLRAFRKDLYDRLRTSFSALECTLSDLQGRVSEIVTASANAESQDDGGESEFKALLAKRTPVTFDVSGTKMSFDAVAVFHAPPCITVVSRSGSATIMPKPGARLLLSYEMDGRVYERDPVTFLGTRFDLPMFGLSFVGFIRDIESDMMDVDDDKASAPEGGAMA